MKMIKLSDTHYVVVDNSEIKESDHFVNQHNQISKCVKSLEDWLKDNDSTIKKITHSTKPLEQYYGAKDGTIPFVYHKIKPLSLSEVEEAIHGYSVDEIAFSQWGGGQTTITIDAFIDGFKAAMELVKDKLFTKKQMEMLFAYAHQIGMNSVLQIQSPHLLHKQDTDKLRDEFIQSLLPKKEWDVEFDENGKLKLL